MYLELQRNTEPPAIFHRWAMITCISAWLGRQAWFPFGSGRIFPNHYVMCIGDPGTRKSTSIKLATKLLRQAGYEYFAPKKASKEKFLLDLMSGVTDDETAPNIDEFTVLDTDNSPREMFIAADEFNIFLGHANLEFLSILGDLWDWDDDIDSWKYRLKNSQSIKIFQPTITILGGNTPTGFAECFPLASIGQGFMSRLIMIYGEQTGKKITFPEAPSPEALLSMVEQLLRIKQKVLGPMQLNSDSRNALDVIYKSWPELEDQRFKHYSTRRFTHLLKLCIVHAASRASSTIELQDVVHANTVLAYAETQMPKAIGELGKSKSSDAANKIMQALYASKKPMQIKELWPVVRMDLEKAADMAQILQNLELAEKIQVIELPDRQRGFLPRQKPINRKILYIDEKYLRGKELPL